MDPAERVGSIASPRPLIVALTDALVAHATRPILVTPARKDGESDHMLTGAQVLNEAARVADGLSALGLKTGENVLLLSENRERWLLVDLALLALGCPDVPRGAEAPADELSYIAQKVRARVAVVERPELLSKLEHAEGALDLVILLSGTPEASTHARRISFEELLAGADSNHALARFHARVAARRADETASIVFTSGTTGRPKGVVLTQRNLASNLAQVLTVIGFLPAGKSFVSILPPWHMFERMVEYALVTLGLQVVYSDRRHFAKDLVRYTPAVIAAVPRLWMLLMEGVLQRLKQAPALKRGLAHAAFALASDAAQRKRFAGHPMMRSRRWTRLLAPLLPWCRRRVLEPVAGALGMRGLRDGIAISGGGTLPDHVDLFFASLGVELVNGYGLTETSPVLAIRQPRRNRGGTVGPPLPETEFQVVDLESGTPLVNGRKGVIHVRGPQVMAGYFEEPAATAAVLTSDGWFNTGDLGYVDPAGELVITGRAKDTIVLLSGENIEPEPIENALTSSPLIEQAVVVGQDQRLLGALIVPRLPAAGAAPTLSQELLLQELRREISERVSLRRGFRAHERIVHFRLLQKPLTVEEGFLSQTLKIKRAVVHERLKAEIDELFREERSS